MARSPSSSSSSKRRTHRKRQFDPIRALLRIVGNPVRFAILARLLNGPQTTSSLSRELKRPYATIHRALQILARHSFVERAESTESGVTYTLGPCAKRRQGKKRGIVLQDRKNPLWQIDIAFPAASTS